MNRRKPFSCPVVWCLFVLALACSCRPLEPLQVQQIKNVRVGTAQPTVLYAEVAIHNPNRMRMKLRRADLTVLINGKPAARIQQDFNLTIPARADFTLPLEVTPNLKDMGFIETLLSALGAKKFEVHYTGMLHLSYRGMGIKLPVNHKNEVRF